MKICIVVPMHNEKAIAEKSIKTILEYAKKLPAAVTVLAVDDGSKDGTGAILNNLAARFKDSGLRLTSHAENLGYGAALKTGARFAADNNFDYVIFMDGDLTNHPK